MYHTSSQNVPAATIVSPSSSIALSQGNAGAGLGSIVGPGSAVGVGEGVRTGLG